MDDLISRAAAVRALASSNGDYLDALERLEKIPAVDAVQAVRCRDCTYYDSEPGGDIMMCYNGLGWTEQNDFCSKGERRESE